MRADNGISVPGRFIESVPYTALLENLSKIAAVASIVGEAPDAFQREDLLNFVVQISELATEGVVLAGSTQEEAAAVFQRVLGGLSFGSAEH